MSGSIQKSTVYGGAPLTTSMYQSSYMNPSQSPGAAQYSMGGNHETAMYANRGNADKSVGSDEDSQTE